MYQLPSLRLALGLGDQELEQRLRPALDGLDDLVVVAQCLAADQLLQAVESRQVDAVVVAWSLHRLTDAVVEQLDRVGLPVVLLVPDPDAERWRARRGPVLGLDVEVAILRQTLLAARRGESTFSRPRPAVEPVAPSVADSRPSQAPSAIIAVAGGAGSPGRTTVAINLAAALGAVAPTVLVEADLAAPAVAAYLDCDPSRNLCTLSYAVREDPHAWSAALADELQPLSRHSPLSAVVCGPPKREMRSSIAPAFVQRLLAELTGRFRYVVVDVGAELLGIEAAAACHRAALASAQRVLLVSGSDMVGLWHARTALDQLEHQVGLDRTRANLVLNRHDARFHHAPSEVEWHLGAPIAAVVPFDYPATQRAAGEQRPLVVHATGRASRALLGLAEHLHNDGQVRLPVEDEADRWWWHLFDRRRPAPVKRLVATPAERSRGPAAAGASGGQAC